MSEEYINVLYVKPNELPEEMTIKNDLETKQKLVNGLIECVSLINDQEVILICNEEGKNRHMKLNRDIGYDIIAGPFIIAGDDYDNGDFKSLTKEQIEKYKIIFDERSIVKTYAKSLELISSKKYIERDER